MKARVSDGGRWARRHHYVPQCYLKGFCRHRAKPKLFVVDVKQRSSFTTLPANVAVERDFHAVEIDGVPLDAIEKSLAEFESDLGPSLERIIAARSIAEAADRANLLRLIATMAVKNPGFRESYRRFEERVIKLVMQVATATPERWEHQLRGAQAAGYVAADAAADYETMKAFVDRDEFSVELSTGRHLSVELPAIDKVLSLMFERRWMLLRAPKGAPGFITSDHPVCLMWSNPEQRGWRSRPPGHGLTGTQIVFPISNELAMIGAFELSGNQERDVGPDEIARINTTIIAYSTRQFFARDGEFQYLSPREGKIKRGVEVLGDRLLTERGEAARRGNAADA